MKTAAARTPAAAARRDTIAKMLCDWLDATTTYEADKEWVEISPPPVSWQSLYGWELAIETGSGVLVDADGKPASITFVKKWTHQPGEMVEGRGGRMVRNGTKRRFIRSRYMVRPDHSLRNISE